MKSYRYLPWITAVYITFQLVSDVSAGKIIQFWMFTVSATVFYFPVTYTFSDILTEVYGYVQARRVVWMVLACSVLAGLVYQFVVILPPALGFEASAAYARVLGSIPRVLLGGWAAVWVGGILNDYILAKMKMRMEGRYLWARTISSTIIGEGANTLIFYVVALYGVIPSNVLWSAVLWGWLLKVAVEILCTPLTYFVVNTLKKAENEDYYDRETDFNPLRF